MRLAARGVVRHRRSVLDGSSNASGLVVSAIWIKRVDAGSGERWPVCEHGFPGLDPDAVGAVPINCRWRLSKARTGSFRVGNWSIPSLRVRRHEELARSGGLWDRWLPLAGSRLDQVRLRSRVPRRLGRRRVSRHRRRFIPPMHSKFRPSMRCAGKSLHCSESAAWACWPAGSSTN